SFTRPIDVPAPDASPQRVPSLPDIDSIMNHLDTRLARARGWDTIEGNPAEGGRSALWVRIPDLDTMSAAALAILGDYVPFGIGQALGAHAGGNSLDNTIRIVRLRPETDWVLVDIQIDGIDNGFGHGTIRMYADDGTLLATASQSTIVRFWDQDKRARRLAAVEAARG